MSTSLSYSGNRKVFIDNIEGNWSLTFSEMERRAQKIPLWPPPLEGGKGSPVAKMSCLSRLGILKYFCKMNPVENLMNTMIILPQKMQILTKSFAYSFKRFKSILRCIPWKNGISQSDHSLAKSFVIQVVEEYSYLPNI